MKPLHIDGSEGEGGGQILRTALALSCITGTPVQFEKIRSGRTKPGLLRQHLAAVNAAGAVAGAKVEGAELGATTLSFFPKKISAGDYRFVVGSAGSALLVLQTILMPLLHADAPSTVAIEGGTHNPWAPPFPFVVQAFLPLLRRIGFKAKVELQRAGFYPAGGGVIVAKITPGGKRAALKIGERGEISKRTATGVVANISRRIAEAEVARLAEKLSLDDGELVVEELAGAPGQGNALFLVLQSEQLTEVFSAFGELGIPAAQVADNLAAAVKRYQKGTGAVGEFLADQLLLPLALAKGGSFTTFTPTKHTLTNIAVIEKFLPAKITSTQTGRIDHTITVKV